MPKRQKSKRTKRKYIIKPMTDAEYVYSIERKVTILVIAVVSAMIGLSVLYTVYKKYEIRKVDDNKTTEQKTETSVDSTSSIGSDIMTDGKNISSINEVMNEHISSAASQLLIDGIDSAAQTMKAPLLRL